MPSNQSRFPDELVFVGFNRRIAALHRATGALEWEWRSPRGTGFVTLLHDGDLLFASCSGYTFALQAATGQVMWSNPLPGFGTGIACLATRRRSTGSAGAAAAQQATDDSSSVVPSPTD